MPYIKIFIKEELKFNKQENHLVNSNTEIKSNNELLHYHNKTHPLLQWAKGTALIAGDSMLHEIDENRLSGAKPNLVKVRIFRGTTIDDMKDFLKPYLKRSPTNIILHVGTNKEVQKHRNTIKKIPLNIARRNHYFDSRFTLTIMILELMPRATYCKKTILNK